MKLPAWVKAKGFSSWGTYMASIRPKPGKRRTRRKLRRSPKLWHGKIRKRSRRRRVRRERTRKNPIAIYNPARMQSRLIYGSLEYIKGRKTKGQVQAGKGFMHRFKPGTAEVRGFADGSLWIKPTQGERLWANESEL